MPILDGVDLSHYQDDAGPIDWPTLRGQTWWCATKATQGIAYIDPTFTAHWAQMRAQGFAHRIAYGWLSANADPVRQANHFLNTVLPLQAGEGCMIDAEEAGITADQVLAWCQTVEDVTQRPVIVYTGAYVAGGTIFQSTAIRKGRYGVRPIHLAAYTSETKMRLLPGVKAYGLHGWQYSSDGPAPGIVGRCDLNQIFDRPAYDTACAITHSTLEDDVTLVTNGEVRQYNGTSYAPGVIKYVAGTHKRHIEEEEWRAVHNAATGIPLSNGILDGIPDAVTGVPDVDYVQLAAHIAPLVPTRFHGAIEVTAAS